MSKASKFIEKRKEKTNMSEEGIKNNYFKTMLSLIEAGIDKDTVVEVFKEYENKKNLYRKNKVYFKDYFNEGFTNKALENFRDDLYKTNIKQNHNQILKRLRNKNNLINKETELITLALAEEGVNAEFIGDSVADKISSIKSSESLNNILKKQLKLIQGEWNIQCFKNKIKDKNVKIISEENNKLVIEVNDFKASSELGTHNWCLVRNKIDYNDYVKPEDGYKKVNFIYNFNKSPLNNESMLAVLSRVDGSVYETYNKKDDLINNANVIDIKFPQMDRTTLKQLINKDFENKHQPNVVLEELITYGFYEEVKKKTTEIEYTDFLLNMFNNSVGKITFSGDVVSFFDELEKNNVQCSNGANLSSWIRESIYLGDYEKVNQILDKDFVKEIIKNDTDNLETDLINIFNDIFRKDNLRGFDFAKELHKKISEIGGDEINDLPLFEIGKYSETALNFIENEMPFIKNNEFKNNKMHTNILKLLEFEYSEEGIENYLKFMNITEKDIDLLTELIDKAKIETIMQGKSGVYPKIKQPIIKIIGKEEFNKKAVLSKEFLNVFEILNYNILSEGYSASIFQDLTMFTIDKLNKEETEKFLNALIGKKDLRLVTYNTATVVPKSVFVKLIEHHKENLDKESINELILTLGIKEKQENKIKRRNRL
jgi:hypothetical protein